MTVEEVAARTGVEPGWLIGLENGTATREVLYSQWVELVKATQPPRPEWWDDGYEHDLSLPADGHHEPTTASGRRYWDRIAAVRSEIEEHYRRGGAGPAPTLEPVSTVEQPRDPRLHVYPPEEALKRARPLPRREDLVIVDVPDDEWAAFLEVLAET